MLPLRSGKVKKAPPKRNLNFSDSFPSLSLESREGKTLRKMKACLGTFPGDFHYVELYFSFSPPGPGEIRKIKPVWGLLFGQAFLLFPLLDPGKNNKRLPKKDFCKFLPLPLPPSDFRRGRERK